MIVNLVVSVEMTFSNLPGWVVQKPVNANLGQKLTKVSVSLVTKHLHC